MSRFTLSHLRAIEAESIHIMREVAAEFARPVMLYSIGKDSSVMVRLAQKAFHPGKLPFPLLHIDTTYKFREMIEFRDEFAASIGARLIVHTNRKAIEEGANPFRLGTQKCCGLLKTRALLDALAEGGFDAAFGGARRDEEKSRAKERVFSFRDQFGQWDPKNQRPELWNLYNGRIDKGETIRVFPLSNWTELDVWQYIHLENIPIVPLYFAKLRPMVVRGETLLPIEHDAPLLPGEQPQMVDVPHAVAGLHALHGRHPFRRRHRPQNHRRDDAVPPFRAREPRHRPRPGRLDGNEEAGGILLDGHGGSTGAARQSRRKYRSIHPAERRDGPASLLHRRQRGRRQEHPHRPAARTIPTASTKTSSPPSVKAPINRSAGAFDLALLTDGLRAEREQGITIDVAYRYFSTPKRKFIIADTPGHEQYTRNMATGASTANLAIVLVDARNGVLPQSRRHAFIASLLGIQHIVVAVNKMDLVDYSEAVFEQIRSEFADYASRLQAPDLHFIPISALKGDNVVEKSLRMPWFDGSSLLHYLETVHIASDRNLTEFRFPVQYVIRPNLDFRGYAGQVASGVVKPGDPVMVLPSGRTSRVKSIVTYDGDLPHAFPPMSVTLCLEDEIDISRGDMLVPPSHPPHVTRRIDARLVWMNERSWRSAAITCSNTPPRRCGPPSIPCAIASISTRSKKSRGRSWPERYRRGGDRNAEADLLRPVPPQPGHWRLHFDRSAD